MGTNKNTYTLYILIFLILVAKVTFVDKQPITNKNVYTKTNDIVNDTIIKNTNDTITKSHNKTKSTTEEVMILNRIQKRKVRYDLATFYNYGKENKRTDPKRSS